jgi:predicted  nucleic acid-binding Zn-ribbon protein
VEIENLSKEHEKVDQKASLLAKQVSSLEVQLADSQDTLQSETKQKLQFQVQLKQAEDRNAALQDQVEEEENARKAIEAKLLFTTSQV